MSVLPAPAMLHPKQSREGGQRFWRSIHSEKLSEQHCAGGAAAPEQSPREKGRAGVLFPGAEALVGSSESFKSPRSIKDQPELGLSTSAPPAHVPWVHRGGDFWWGPGVPLWVCVGLGKLQESVAVPCAWGGCAGFCSWHLRGLTQVGCAALSGKRLLQGTSWRRGAGYAGGSSATASSSGREHSLSLSRVGWMRD